MTRLALGSGGASHVEAELHDVAVRHDVVLALHADPTSLLGLEHGAGSDEVVEGDDLGLDEAALEVGVDDAGGLGGRGALLDRPGPRSEEHTSELQSRRDLVCRLLLEKKKKKKK